jgi:DNA mismatch repair protein MutS2
MQQKKKSVKPSNLTNYPLDTLEFGQIKKYLSTLAVSECGRDYLLKSDPYQDIRSLEDALSRVTEMRELIAFDEAFPLHHFSDLQIPLQKAEVVGAFLQPDEIKNILNCLVLSRQIVTYMNSRQEKYPRIHQYIGNCEPLPLLEMEITRIISEHGDIKDNASSELKQIRRSIQLSESRIRQRLEAILRSMVKEGHAQEDRLTIRDGRLVIPMKEGHAGKIQGVIIDQSSTGATLFIEPLEILESNNEVRKLRIRETREMERILVELTGKIRENLVRIKYNFQCLILLDGLTAKARYSQEIDGCAAKISEATLVLKEARHPILLMSHERQDVVPLTLKLGDPVQTLLITGPNAGGKTVALKTLGLLSIMHAHGYHVPAAPGTEIPLFFRIFADIGDQQSIEQDLSTFSSHIRNIARIVQEAGSNSLVLMDEIGSATDPLEGSALAMTVLESLTRSRCLTVATTHMGALKVFAHENEGMENGSMIFDQDTLQPTYCFQMGIPGSSYAFEIARRYGIPDVIVNKAETMLGEERGQLDRLIHTLQTEHQRLDRLTLEAERKDSQLKGLITLYEERLQRIKNEAQTEKQKLLEEAENILGEANTTIERVVKDIRESNARREVIQQAKQSVESQKKSVEKLRNRKKASPRIKRGSWVVWEGYPGSGEVVSEPDRNRRVLVQWADRRLKVPVEALRPTQAPTRNKSAGITSFVNRMVRDEIDLRGMNVDEALHAVEQYLGDAHSAGLNSVRIIHGKGTGVLRREIGHFLEGHRLIKNQRLGFWNEGDTGVTIVELK